jgi:hypothetical protein
LVSRGAGLAPFHRRLKEKDRRNPVLLVSRKENGVTISLP